MRAWLNYVADAIRRPREELSRRQHQVRYIWDLVVHCARQLTEHRAEGMAAELTYRTIFSLIPVVVLGLVMFRVVGGLEDVQSRVENQLYSFFGVPEIPTQYLRDQIEEIESEQAEVGGAGSDMSLADTGVEDDTETDTEDGTEAGQGEPEPEMELTASNRAKLKDAAATQEATVEAAEVDEALAEAVQDKADETASEIRARASIRRTLSEVTAQIASLDFASIGVIGLLLFIYAAVALADSTEHLFNIIYDAPRQRPIHLRLAIHWSIITLGSGLLALSLYMSGQVVAWAGTIGAGREPLWFLQHSLSLLAGWVLMFLLFALMPNTHVSVRAAAIGAGVAAVLWEFAKYGFQIYVSKAVPYSALYGSLGLIPLFLFWIYVTWLIVLFGLTLTYTLQTMRGRRLRRSLDVREAACGDPDWMLPIMTEVATAFREGRSLGRQELADRLGLASRVVHEMENQLIESGCLRRVSGSAGEEDLLTLARPAETIAIRDVLELAHRSRVTNDHHAWRTLADLKQAERDAAGDRTLADVLGGGDAISY
ncbi:membrane protein [Neorhodopirellula lusitana]|uniref:Membrane protein n=1 Tax=Neorhodopirellula lusitana TaxID=445327 RepID=A0ABY1Q9J7_9BACT|nr:YihY/virulence factor BrkB family protein [Neorhodopirellula lusitana]SMP63323.1 membrane protein [Neorhodopirellula lusitana]